MRIIQEPRNVGVLLIRASKQFLSPLTPPEQSALLRALSDLESGSPRQWLLLEIAATLGPAQTSRRTRVAAWLASGLGMPVLLPLMEHWQLPGVAIYRGNARLLGHCARRALDDASLLLVSLTALLAGFDRLPASRQFLAWLLLLLGGAIKYWRVRKQHPVLPEPEISGEEALPGAEAALGLQGLLLARGVTPAEAQVLRTSLALSPLTTALPELLPPLPAPRDYLCAALAGWIVAILPALWLNGWQWGWIGSVLWVAGLGWLAHRRKTFVALLVALALASFGLARIAHWL